MLEEKNISILRPPRILFLSDWGTEDYGVAYSYDGLCDAFGNENVVDWPSNPYFHHTPLFVSPHCDAVLQWPATYHHEHEIATRLRNGEFDLCVIGGARDLVLGSVRQFAPWLHFAKGIVILDMEDDPKLTVEPLLKIEEVSQHCVAIMKREFHGQFPDSKFPVYPFPFGYPRSRAMRPYRVEESSLVFYHAHDWGWADTSPRHKMVSALKAVFGDDADVGLSLESGRRPGEQPLGRLTVPEYRSRLRNSKIAISLNEGGGSDTNRYWEAAANGCVLVSDPPRHQIMYDFEHGKECFIYNSIDEAVSIVRMLRDNPAKLEEVAWAGHSKFMAAHASTIRATQIVLAAASAFVQRGQLNNDWLKVG